MIVLCAIDIVLGATLTEPKTEDRNRRRDDPHKLNNSCYNQNFGKRTQNHNIFLEGRSESFNYVYVRVSFNELQLFLTNLQNSVKASLNE